MQRRRRDQTQPVSAYRFMVELDGLLVAGFSEVSGLVVETQVEEYREGGLNQFTHRLPAQTVHVPLILKRGMTKSNELWNWYAAVTEGRIERKSGSIILFDEFDQEYRRWNFYDGYPVKWSGPELQAMMSEVAVEYVELVHNGFKMM
ncbi:phage tail protein [Paenibacillus yanchengensis]|uniref:Phage tail protein n=1 Tax=Paenibacillus yanchengensis TaxID=2035833 RepID=A0ABW4YEQ8_9BACL